jgi:hypothetical protein
MAYTYSKISTYTVGSGGIKSVSFANIPQNYTDLVVKASLRSTGTVSSYSTTFNGSSSGYSERLLYGTGSVAASAASTSASYIFWAFNTNETGSTASTFASNEFYIPNYTSSKYKPLSISNVTENNATGATAYLDAALWSNTEPITNITMTVIGSTGVFAQYSSFHLYGIKAEL